MAWTLTAVAARGRRLVGAGGRWSKPAAVERAAVMARQGNAAGSVFARAYARRLKSLAPADIKALEAAAAELGDDHAVLQRAVASGAPIAACAGLAAAWAGLPRTHQDVIRHPAGLPLDGHTDSVAVTFQAVRAVQRDQTTCGAASMAMMVMMGDPLVSAWLMTGRTFGDYFPPEVFQVEVRGLTVATVGERWSALQWVLHQDVTRHGIGPFPWPKAWGTPPWRLDNATRFASVRFRGAVIDDTDAHAMDALVEHIRAALADGIPVPLYAAGDSSRGLATALPRHVTLIVGFSADALHVYEPSAGAVVALPLTRLTGGGAPHPALGWWTRVAWLVLPSPTSS